MKLLALLSLPCVLVAQSLSISAGCVASCVPAAGFIQDKYFTGGSTQAIAGGQGVYAQLRYGVAFSYDIPRTNGLYDVRFNLAEPSQTAAGLRVFTIVANGASTPALDMFALAGFQMPDPQTVRVLVSSGNLHIAFASSIRTAFVNGIEITPVSQTGPILLSIDSSGTFQPVTLGPTLQLVGGMLITSFTLPQVAQMEQCIGSPVSPGSVCTGLYYIALSNGTAYIAAAPPTGFTLGAGWSPTQ
jgi:hypothetical protein